MTIIRYGWGWDWGGWGLEEGEVGDQKVEDGADKAAGTKGDMELKTTPVIGNGVYVVAGLVLFLLDPSPIIVYPCH